MYGIDLKRHVMFHLWTVPSQTSTYMMDKIHYFIHKACTAIESSKESLNGITLFPVNGVKTSSDLEEDFLYLDSKDEDKHELKEDPEEVNSDYEDEDEDRDDLQEPVDISSLSGKITLIFNGWSKNVSHDLPSLPGFFCSIQSEGRCTGLI